MQKVLKSKLPLPFIALELTQKKSKVDIWGKKINIETFFNPKLIPFQIVVSIFIRPKNVAKMSRIEITPFFYCPRIDQTIPVFCLHFLISGLTKW